MASNKSPTSPRGGVQGRLPFWRAMVFGLAGLPVYALAAALLIYLPPHLATQLGVPLVVVGGVWATVRLIDIGFDPVLGMVMDRTRTRLGRYRPWMMLATPLLMAGVALLFFAPAGVGMAYLVGGLLVLYAAMSMLSLAHPSWGATLAKGYADRSRIFGIMATVAIVALLAVLAISAVLGKDKNGDATAVHVMGWFIIGMTPLVVGVAIAMTPERVAPAAEGHQFRLSDVGVVLRKTDLLRLYGAQLAMALGPGWTSSIFLFFATDYMHFSSAEASRLLLFYVSAGLIGAPTVAWIGTKVGKHRAIMMAAIAYSVAFMTVLSPPKGVFVWSIPVNVWCGFWGSGFELTIRSMLADVADEVRLDHGRDHLSLIYALNTASAKVAAALAIVITFPLLQVFGFAPKLGLHNSPAAIRALGLTFVAGPIVCVMMGALCMIGWKLTADRHHHIRIALEARDAAAALGIVDGEHTDEAALKAGQASAA